MLNENRHYFILTLKFKFFFFFFFFFGSFLKSRYICLGKFRSVMNTSNATDMYDTQTQSFAWTLHDIIKGTTFSVMTTVVVVGNIICLLALKHTRIKPSTRVLMYSLNTADLCLGVFVLFPLAVSSFVNANVFGYIGCFINVIIGGTTSYTSNWTLLAMAVERYIAVTKPLKYRVIFTLRRAWMTVVFIWIASQTFEILVCGLNEFQVYFHHRSDQCWSLGLVGRDHYIKLAVIALTFGPLLSFTILYMRIFWVMRQQLILRREMTKSMNSQEQQNHGRLSSQETKTAHTFMLITLAFFVTSGVATSGWIYNSTRGEESNEWIYFFFTFTVSSNSWLNTVIYFLRNESFRKSVQDLFKRNKSNVKRETTFSSISGSMEK